jgi:hypothetical protein
MPALADTAIDDAWADDPILARLRAARPDCPSGLVDPRAPAASRLADHITAGPRRSPTRRRLAVMAAAATVVVGAVIVGRPGPSGPPPAEAIVREAAAASQKAFTTGRAIITSPDGELAFGDRVTYTFAGEDLRAEIEGERVDGTRFVAERRVVDGELYWNPGATGRPVWFHDADPDSVSVSQFVFDPRGLLAVLEPDAGFEVVGDEVLDGVAVTRLRATTPGEVDADALDLGEATAIGGTVEELEVWVDADRVLRGIDVTLVRELDDGTVVLRDVGDGVRLEIATEPVVTRASVRFTDLGESITVEAPATYEDVDLSQAVSAGP